MLLMFHYSILLKAFQKEKNLAKDFFFAKDFKM